MLLLQAYAVILQLYLRVP